MFSKFWKNGGAGKREERQVSDGLEAGEASPDGGPTADSASESSVERVADVGDTARPTEVEAAVIAGDAAPQSDSEPASVAEVGADARTCDAPTPEAQLQPEPVEPVASAMEDGDEQLDWSGVSNPAPLAGPRQRGRRLAKAGDSKKPSFTGQQRLLILDTWRRSGLPAKDFAPLVGVSRHTLYAWKRMFEQHGPKGLMDQPRKRSGSGSRLPEVTRRAILMLKEANPQWGCQRISDMLLRGPALPASASAVARVLREAGYVLVDEATRRHPQRPRRFERARPNQMWQTDLFTFMLKRQNRRVYLVAFLDDHSRFVVSFGLTASASTNFVIEVLEAGVSRYGAPEEVLTDNGPQYKTWRGTSRFTQHVEKRGIRQIVARPKHPQTLGKVERFWGTLWREFLETIVFLDMEDARRRIGLFIDHYNLARPHRGIEGLVPADRFFGAAPEVLKTLKQRVQANTLQLARHGVARQPFYVTGNVDGQQFSVHAEGERLILNRPGEREEVELTRPSGEPRPQLPAALCPDGSPSEPAGEPAICPPLPPGVSGLDDSSLAGLDNGLDDARDLLIDAEHDLDDRPIEENDQETKGGEQS